MAGAGMLDAAHRPNRLQGAHAPGCGRPRSRHHGERSRSAYFAAARQAWRCGHHPQPARARIPIGRNETRVTSSISRRLIFWLTVPLMLMALCGSLVHYFNSIAPGVISSDRRLKEAANALMTHVLIKEGQLTL